MFDLDMRSSKPIYEQLIERFKDLIIHGVLNVDEQLPSVRSLAQQLTINPNTIQKAYRELEREGFTYSIKGRGHFVQTRDHHRDDQLKKVKIELEKRIAEAFYLGMTKTSISELVNATEQRIKGGDLS